MIKHLLVLILSVSCLPLHAKHDVPPTSEFKVTGAVKKELRFGIDDLVKFRQDTVGDIVIRNKRGEEKGAARHMKGVLLKTILDSAGIVADKPKEYSELVIILTASDGYKNVYSWSEVFNTETGDHVYIITEMDGRSINDMSDRILVVSLSDINSGRRHLKSLAKIEIKKI